MTELLIFLLTLLGIDADPTSDLTGVRRTSQQVNAGKAATSSTKTGKSLAGGPGSDKIDIGGSRGGGSRQIGGPVIVFDDVMFKPVGN